MGVRGSSVSTDLATDRTTGVTLPAGTVMGFFSPPQRPGRLR